MSETHDLKRWLSMLRRATEADPVAGDLLTYQGNNQAQWWDGGGATGYLPRNEWLQNGFVSRADNSLTFTNGTRTFDISPTGVDFDYYLDGIRYITTGDDIVISVVDGMHWIYYNDGTGTLTEIVNPSTAQIAGLIEDECLVAMVYWNNNTAEGYLFDERHGYSMSPVTHRLLHETVGVMWAEGVGIVDILTDQNGALDTHAQFGNTTGEIYDEDVDHTINAVAGGGTYECWWWDGTRWQWDTNAGFPFLVGGTPQPQYNNFAAGTLVEGGNTNFVLTHLFATAAEDGNPIIIVGQAVYTNINNAREGAATEIAGLLLGTLPSPELKPIATVIIEIRNAYANTNNCRTRTTLGGHDFIDWRTNPISPGGSSVSDHGSLGGLADDDHVQYLIGRDARCRVFHNAAQAANNAAWQALTFNSETFDPSGMHDAVNPTRITFADAGRYFMEGGFSWAANLVGQRCIRIRINGVTVVRAACFAATAHPTGALTMALATFYEVGAGDHAELEVYQNSGGALNVLVNASFGVHRLS